MDAYPIEEYVAMFSVLATAATEDIVDVNFVLFNNHGQKERDREDTGAGESTRLRHERSMIGGRPLPDLLG